VKAIARRQRRLAYQLGPEDGKRLLLVVCPAGSEEVLDIDRCIQILDDCEFLTHGMGLVYLGSIPRGLNADKLEQHLRVHGAVISLF